MVTNGTRETSLLSGNHFEMDKSVTNWRPVSSAGNKLYLLFPLEKKGILISYQSRSVVGLSVPPSLTFLVNVDVAASNLVT